MSEVDSQYGYNKPDKRTKRFVHYKLTLGLSIRPDTLPGASYRGGWGGRMNYFGLCELRPGRIPRSDQKVVAQQELVKSWASLENVDTA